MAGSWIMDYGSWTKYFSTESKKYSTTAEGEKNNQDSEVLQEFELNMVMWDHDESLSLLEGGGREID
jgi:hypothetical protein